MVCASRGQVLTSGLLSYLLALNVVEENFSGGCFYFTMFGHHNCAYCTKRCLFLSHYSCHKATCYSDTSPAQLPLKCLRVVMTLSIVGGLSVGEIPQTMQVVELKGNEQRFLFYTVEYDSVLFHCDQNEVI